MQYKDLNHIVWFCRPTFTVPRKTDFKKIVYVFGAVVSRRVLVFGVSGL